MVSKKTALTLHPYNSFFQINGNEARYNGVTASAGMLGLIGVISGSHFSKTRNAVHRSYKSVVTKLWTGIIAYAGEGPGLNEVLCKDFDMIDFRHVANYFLSYAYVPLTAVVTVEHVKSVRIDCIGYVKMHQRPQFEQIELPTTDAISTQHDTSDIADRIGISILTRRCPADSSWANRDRKMFGGTSPTQNQNAAFLHMCCDPSAELDIMTGSLGWGWCPMRWTKRVGSAIVVRKDRKPLLPMHMEAIPGYCRHEIQPLMAHSIGEYAPEKPIEKDLVLKIICRPMFVLYWSKFAEARKDYETPSPYYNDA